jgi:hypothetical protein
MVIFHVVGKPNLTILVFYSKVIQVTENVLYVMFVFQRRVVHVSKYVSYEDDNIILSFVYQVLDVNLGGMFWTITTGKYWIIDDNVLNNFQNTIVTSSKIASC